jgi:hypothetical protein
MIRRLFPIAIAAALVLSGCAADDDYPAATAQTLQAHVLEVTQSAASGDPAAALKRLDELVVVVKDALARETITAERHDSILSAIDLVRVDLEAAIAAIEQEQQENEEKPGKGPDKGDKPPKEDKGNKGEGDDGNDD